MNSQGDHEVEGMQRETRSLEQQLPTKNLRAPRHQPVHILRNCNVPCVVWFEDAIAHYGVPTVVFDLYVLVPDIDIAVQLLIQHGWTLVPQEHGRIGNAEVDSMQYRLALPFQDHLSRSHPQPSIPSFSDFRSPITTVLLPAADWNFNLEGHGRDHVQSSYTDIFPPLAGLLDALIDSLLDCPFTNVILQSHLACQVACLYGHVPELQDQTFADNLIHEHRQYHFDVLSGMTNGTRPFISHQRNVREAIRQGTHEFQECSAPKNDQYLFTGAWEARLLAAMRDRTKLDQGQEDIEIEVEDTRAVA
jgi:hypothetical protein